MAKVALYGFRLAVLLAAMLCDAHIAHAQYVLHIRWQEADSLRPGKPALQTEFKNQPACAGYVNELPATLQMQGYPAASVDSVRYDSAAATVLLFLGPRYKWVSLHTDSIEPRILEAVGWRNEDYRDKPVNLTRLEQLQNKMLDYLENNGYPFARLRLDSIRLQEEQLSAVLILDKGPLYKIDSIRNFGQAAISNRFLQRYLNILNGSVYQRTRLQTISRKLSELPFLEEQQHWDITYLGTGSVLNLYLKPKRSSQVNVLVGFLPATQASNNIYEAPRSKLQFTGEATINLRNALGNGESMSLNWQQIQVRSPRLNLAFQQPYLFGSPFGINASFDLFKKDSSFQNIVMVLGMQYAASADRTGSIFLQNNRSYLLTVDTFAVKSTHQLPLAADLSSINLGLSYDINATNYRFNPRRGNEMQAVLTVGTKKVRKNSVIVQLHDENDPGFDFNSLYDTVRLSAYQFRLKWSCAHYFPIGRASTLKTALQAGWYQSPSIYWNELFQIGGYRLLRGFDEESIYASVYSVATVEYRYLIGMNSYFSGFTDFGLTGNHAAGGGPGQSFFGAGLGLAFETKAGIFNISFAAGKRNDQAFNLRASKIHLGFLSYF